MSDQPQHVEPTALPLYVCHKRVRAAKIESIESLGDNWLLCFTVNGKQAAYPITTRWLERHEPKLGGYFVAYADGYTSYSPADAFEGGYVLDV